MISFPKFFSEWSYCFSFLDIDECAKGLHTCDIHAYCNNMYVCNIHHGML